MAGYGELLALEVARATASPAAWGEAREHERRHAAAEAEWAAEKHWKGLKSELDRRRLTCSPATTVRATVTPSAAAPRAAPLAHRAAAVGPRETHAAELEQKGLHFTAQAERRAIVEADHGARRRRV